MESLLSQFNAVYPTFMSSLLKRYPVLSQSDLQFCTMIRMNLSTKEISSLFNIEQRSVYARKYRIMKKIGLNEDDNLESVLFAIE
jgi:DNA-binding CsgD family transcriptional regulator